MVGRGTVVRYMRDGSTQMLFVTGKMRGCVSGFLASVVEKRSVMKVRKL